MRPRRRFTRRMDESIQGSKTLGDLADSDVYSFTQVSTPCPGGFFPLGLQFTAIVVLQEVFRAGLVDRQLLNLDRGWNTIWYLNHDGFRSVRISRCGIWIAFGRRMKIFQITRVFFVHFQFVGRLNCWAGLDIPSRKIFSPRLVWTIQMMAHLIN